MFAMVIEEPGPPEALQLREVPDPLLQRSTDVLVRVHAAGVNHLDSRVRSGAPGYPVRLPAVLGCDGAGVVEAVGAGVQGLSPGDEVYFLQCGFGARSGTYGEWAVVDAALVALKPSSLSMQQAGAAPLVLIAAWESVYGHGALQPDQRVLIHGGAGGVGHIAIQLARLRGARVCTTVSTAEKAALAASVGADEVIYYREENFNLAILEWSEEDGVDLAIDTVGGQTFEHSFTAVRCYGNLVTLQQPPAQTNWTVARQRNLKIGLEMVLTPIYLGMEQEMQRQGQILRDCARLIDEGKLRIHLDREFALDAAAEAHRCLEAGEARGKLALGVI